MYQPRDYQAEAIEAGLAFFNASKAEGALMVEPTGSGKSIIIAGIAKELPGRTLVLQPNVEILHQNYAKMAAYVGEEDLGIYSASANRKDIGKITFATILSIYQKPHLFTEFDHLIIDEAHLVNAKGGVYEKMITELGVPVLGLTATPYRMHAFTDFKSQRQAVVAKFLTRTKPRLFSKIIHVTQIQRLYEKGFLCPINYSLNGAYDMRSIALNSTGMDFDQDSLRAYNNKMGVVGITANAIRLGGFKHILVFNPSVEEAESLMRELRASGFNVATVSAKTPKKERAEILEGFKAGRINVVTNVGVLTTGFDFPELDCLILARPTQSVALYYQMIGRGIRIAPGKKEVKVIDACGNVSRFGKIETFEIVEPKPSLHRLKSDTKFLTGFDFVDEIDLESRDYKGFKESEGTHGKSAIVNFGKYKGWHITKVPNEYLDWIIMNFDDGHVKTNFLAEKERRTK